MLDTLITGGRVLDGSGNAPFYGSIGITNGRIEVLRGDVSSVQARQVLDATGKFVTPGFIDLHAHSALTVLADPYHEPKLFQGITTELLGIDGNSYAPFHDHEDLLKYVRMNSGLEGYPDIPIDWLSVAEYLDRYDGTVACNIAYVAGNSPLRISSMGWKARPADPYELKAMQDLTRRALEEGAFGISTGLDYPPGSYADTSELVKLGEEVASLGGIYHTHVRNSLGDRFLDPFREAIDIGRRSGVPIHVTHFFQRSGKTGAAYRLLNLIDEAEGEGLDVTFDSHPYNFSSSRMVMMIPQWAHDGGPDALLDVLRSSEGRRRLEDEIVPLAESWADIYPTYFKRARNQRFEGKSIADIAAVFGKGPVATFCDLLVDEDLCTSYVAPGASGNPMSIMSFLQHPRAMFATDGLLIGDNPAPRSYGMMPFILGELVLQERYLDLADAIRKMTSAPAQRLGLRSRGLLRDGFMADVVVFDPATVQGPASRRDPKAKPLGIDYVLVNGSVVVEHGKHTGVLPGRALRRGQD